MTCLKIVTANQTFYVIVTENRVIASDYLLAVGKQWAEYRTTLEANGATITPL